MAKSKTVRINLYILFRMFVLIQKVAQFFESEQTCSTTQTCCMLPFDLIIVPVCFL